MELMIPLSSRQDMPYYQQIYQFIKEEIRRGNLKPSMRLPSTRLLAQNLKVSRSTTQMAYEQLLSEGYIEAKPCKGYFVSGIDELVHLEGVKEQEKDSREPGETQGKDNGGRQAGKKEPETKVDFSPRGIDLEAFPFNTWRKLYRNILVDDRKELFSAGDPMGEENLRLVIRDYLHSARGVNCMAEQIVVGAGSEYLLMLLSRLLGKNTSVAMENPTYRQAFRVLKSMGVPMVPVNMDGSGMDVGLLEKSGAQTAYIMPSHQYPTGIVMPIKRRQELLCWAYEEERRYLIEDDYDSEFRYKGKPIPALQGMDGGGRVIYMGTFSKSIAPAIRVSFMVLPPALLEEYHRKAGFYSSTVSRIDQQILYQFMVGGYYERHLNRMRAVYKAKHDLILSGLRPFEKEFSLKGEYAGLHLLLTHRGQKTEEELVEAAASAGVKVYGLSSYFIGEKPCWSGSTVILGYASLKEEEITRGLKLLKEVWGIDREKENR